MANYRQVPNGPSDQVCPFHKETMDKVCSKCPLWVHLRGKHPQSEDELDEWNCALAWQPVLMIEGAQQTRQAGAAIESFRNEVVKANQETARQLAAGAYHTLRLDQLPSDRAR